MVLEHFERKQLKTFAVKKMFFTRATATVQLIWPKKKNDKESIPSKTFKNYVKSQQKRTGVDYSKET